MRTTLLDGVYADPDADGPREVLADWLIEQGDPFGEFVALQLARHRTDGPQPAWGRRAGGLPKREKALFRQHGAAWFGDVPIDGLWEPERGFPRVAHLGGMPQRYPRGPLPGLRTLRTLRLTRSDHRLDRGLHAFLLHPGLANVTAIHRLAAHDLPTVVQASFQLRRLTLFAHGHAEEAVGDLWRLPRLRALHVRILENEIPWLAHMPADTLGLVEVPNAEGGDPVVLARILAHVHDTVRRVELVHAHGGAAFVRGAQGGWRYVNERVLNPIMGAMLGPSPTLREAYRDWATGYDGGT